MKRLRVLMTRQEIEPERLADATVVVIDVFLATTTLLTILENDARAVYPVASLEEADRVGERLDRRRLLRGGEQGAKRVEGYDLGPYPEEYAPSVVSGKDVIFVTTNGTRAIGAASGAGELLLGCLRNAPAVARRLETSGTESVYVVCAGSAGRFTLEDFLGASAIVSRLNKDGYLEDWRLNDAAWTALDFAKRHEGEEAEVLKQSRAGRWFFEHDKVEEFRFVADVGASDLVPKVVDGRLEKAVSGQPSAVSKKNDRQESRRPKGGTVSETIAVRRGEDFDVAAVERYLRERVEGLPEGDLEVRQFPSGASNLTFLLKVREWEGVLRRPPLGPVPPKAHDMGREANVLARLHPHFPLAPEPYFFTDDESVIGAPFYVMERRRGVVVNESFPEGVEPTQELCRGLSETLCDTLVRLHAVDWRQAGLDDLGRPEGFLGRQVKGWIGRYDKAKTEEVEEAAPLGEWLSANVPESPEPTIIHNDYKLNNLVLDADDPTTPVALLDWEMTTVGDPLFDLAVSLSYYVEPDDPEALKKVMPTVTDTPGFMTREEFMRRYAEGSGRDVSEMHWYLVFGYFKLAAIIQQIYARYAKGQTSDERFADFGERARNVLVHANDLARKGSL